MSTYFSFPFLFLFIFISFSSCLLLTIPNYNLINSSATYSEEFLWISSTIYSYHFCTNDLNINISFVSVDIGFSKDRITLECLKTEPSKVWQVNYTLSLQQSSSLSTLDTISDILFLNCKTRKCNGEVSGTEKFQFDENVIIMNNTCYSLNIELEWSSNDVNCDCMFILMYICMCVFMCVL